MFEAFDYVALGHLHGKQTVSRPTVRYCGTPLKYSFSEKDHVKSVTIVEMGAKGDTAIRERELKPLHDMREIKGRYDDLMLKKNYEGTATDDYIHAVLTDEDDITDAIAKLRVIYQNIMKLSYDNKRTAGSVAVSDAEGVERKTPVELFGEFFEKQNNRPMSEEQSEFVSDQIRQIWG